MQHCEVVAEMQKEVIHVRNSPIFKPHADSAQILCHFLGGDFLLMNTAANGLQVFNQNDNGWDQVTSCCPV